MKRMRVISTVLCVMMLGLVSVSAQKGANFAGTWELDKSKSQLPQMMAEMIQSMSWTVTQDDKQVTREQKMERNPNAQPPGGGGGGGGGGRGGGMMGGGGPLTVKLDGSESVSESPRGKATTTAKWLDGGKILEIKTVTNASTPQGDFTLTTAEHWEVADGGKTLKVHRTQETPRGKQESTLVLTKK